MPPTKYQVVSPSAGISCHAWNADKSSECTTMSRCFHCLGALCPRCLVGHGPLALRDTACLEYYTFFSLRIYCGVIPPPFDTTRPLCARLVSGVYCVLLCPCVSWIWRCRVLWWCWLQFPSGYRETSGTSVAELLLFRAALRIVIGVLRGAKP